MSLLRAVMAIYLCSLLSGCSTLTFGLLGDDDGGQVKGSGPTLGNLVQDLPQLELAKVAQIKPTREQVMAAYNRVYGMLPSARENHAVGKRLADLHMARGEDLDIEGQAQPYEPAVALYEDLLLQTPNSEGVESAESAEKVDEILYQLARAYDLSGNTERTLHYLNRLITQYPDSEYIPEGRFRRGELMFSADDYAAAAQDYGYVVSLGEQSNYYRNASYMLGWSEFKRSHFEAGLQQFFNVVDALLRVDRPDQTTALNKELLKDSFRVVTLALFYLDGAQTLAEEMRRRGRPDWQYLAYQHLANDYFEKERFLDNVATWQTFIEHNSLDARAPAAHKGMIKTLIDAGFPSDVLPKKKEFVVRYGVYSNFWSHHDDQVRSGYLQTLHTYLSELAKLAHADAQQFDAKDASQQRTSAYLAAAQWYEEIIVTFPGDPRTAEYLFLLGETYTEAQEPGLAVAAYQRVVRDFPSYPDAHEAGYAAILGLAELVATAANDELELWQRLKIDAQIEFALLFSADERAPAVQIDAADTLFTLGHTAEALDLAENLLQEWPDVADPLEKTALLIIGHGRFELDEFALAESAYHRLLAMQLNEDEQPKVAERLLAAVYKQGEASESLGEVDSAVYHYMRIAELDPGATLAAQGHFDAIAAIEGAGRIAEAATLLAQFRNTYPHHELAGDIDVRLASLYEQSENWAAAAIEYVGLSKSASDKEVRRQSLYRAAEIYLAENDVAAAIEYFRDYAHTYKRPLDIRMEAIHNMDGLYQRDGDEQKRRFWLNKKIEVHKEMGRAATARATHLAASAQLVFANDERLLFAAIQLTRPLKRSLKKKQRALKKTLKAFEKVAAYEVAEFTTASTYEIADLYSALSKSIMASDRPQDLSALEIEQYDILLEEQAFPFEDQAIDLHEINLRRAWAGTYDEWVRKSFAELMRLMPGRFNKPESEGTYAQAIH